MFKGLGMIMTSRKSSTSLTYATWNPSDKAANISLSGGDLTTTRGGVGPAAVRGTIGKSSGKWYWEVKCISTTGVFDIFVGLANTTASLTALPGSDANGWALALDDGGYYHSGLIALVNGGVGFVAAVNDVFGFAWDADSSTLAIYRNNTVLTPDPLFSTLSGTLYPIIATQNDTTVMTANFGATTMAYTAPGGFNQGLYN